MIQRALPLEDKLLEWLLDLQHYKINIFFREVFGEREIGEAYLSLLMESEFSNEAASLITEFRNT